MKSLLLLALLCCLATAFAAPATTVKWCVISDQELSKCHALAQRAPVFSCVKRESPYHCIVAIKAGEADAITLSGENIYTAGLKNYNLVPIIAEDYISDITDACFYSVATAKKNTDFGLKDLRGKKACHSGLGDAEGWTHPIGTLLTEGVIPWTDPDDKPLLEAVAEFFSANCLPGATGHPTLCQLCKGDCSKTSNNLYYGDDGAFRCLKEDAGQVAFIKLNTIPASEKNNYELLCKDNTRASIDNHETCTLGREPAHAVVSRNDKDLVELIWTGLTTVRGFDLFSSDAYGGKNLMFSDSTKRLQQVPPDTDSFLYLGADLSKIYSLNKGQTLSPSSASIKWCAVGHDEIAKCNMWYGNSFNPKSQDSAIECQSASTVEECFKKIMRQEADAVAVDGGQVYTAGKCGLVPVMAEQYVEGYCGSPVGVSVSSYYSVAVVKKGSGVTWANLKGKRSCHTAIGRTAGWNIPMGHIHSIINDCDFTKFFSSGCAPGSDLTSPFCRQCVGSGKAVGDESKCKASADERYYGYAGAFRCLAEDAGDVAFIKHTIVGENTDGKGPDWARDLRSKDFELICPDNDSPIPIGNYKSCNLAVVPAHAVITRPEIRDEVVRILKDQQAKFGTNGTDDKFRMFESENGKNLLFKDSTKCLQEVPDKTFETFLGPNYMAAMGSLRKCSGTAPDVEKSCTFQTCQ